MACILREVRRDRSVQRTETMSTKAYPNISDILERKASGRANLRARSFAEKLDALDALRDRVGPLRAAVAARKERDDSIREDTRRIRP